jgi:hypothetical protein
MARCCQSLGECARDYFHLIVLISAFFNAYACLCRILDVCTVICGGSPCLRMRQGGRLTVLTMKGGRRKSRCGGLGVPLGWPGGHGGGEETPSESKFLGDEEDEQEEG